jgi:hypothetical protein
VAGFDGNGTVHGSHLKPATGQILTVCVAQGPVQGQFPDGAAPIRPGPRPICLGVADGTASTGH